MLQYRTEAVLSLL